MSDRVLFVLPYSPWSERARWALLHHGLPFQEREHLPLLGEVSLRRRAKRWRGVVSVPLLVDGEGPTMDSLAIAEYADRHGQGSPLLPAALVDDIRAWNALVEPLFDACRARLAEVVEHDDGAALDLVPRALRWIPFARAAGRLGTRFVARKHRTSYEAIDERIRGVLHQVRRRLAGRSYVHDDFSYADIIGATAIHFVNPVDDRYVPISAVKRRVWTQADVSREFADLVEWRDALYAKHRPCPV